MNKSSKTLAVFLMAGTLAIPATSASAAPLAPAAAAPAPLTATVGGGTVEKVQWRRGGWRGGHRWHRGRGRGVGISAAILGGAILGSALAARPRHYGYAPRSSDEIAYCQSRFRSYDPASGTYLGYDGNRHPCP